MTITRHVFWVALASVGCATPMKAMREDNRRLSQSVADLRAERRAQDRKVRDLEHQLAIAKVKADQEVTPMPELPVEVVAPPNLGEGQRLAGVTDDGIQIIYEGDAALGKAAVMDSEPARTYDPPRARARESRRAVSAARASRTPVRRDASLDTAGTDYRAAVELVRGGKSEEAIVALRAFLEAYPRHEYADNAQYWLGEAFYAQKDYDHALVEFRATIETYPRGNKVPDALLKVGYCYQALGKTDKARAVLEQVVNLYPKTEPAALASKRLETP